MRSGEAHARLGLIEALSTDHRSEALRSYAELATDMETAVVAAGQAQSWKLEAAEALVSHLLRTVASELHDDVTATTRNRLTEALTAGPQEIDRLDDELTERMRLAQQPEELLRSLRARRRCLELRMRCLDHLEAIFETRRCQP